MEQQSPPRRPMSTYFLFREAEFQKGHAVSSSQLARKWKKMTEEEKKPYVAQYKKAKAEYNQYRISIGMPPTSSNDSFNIIKIKTVCNSQKLIQPMDTAIYKGLGKVLEALLVDLGKKLGKTKIGGKIGFKQMKEEIERTSHFEFLKEMKEYDVLVKNIADEEGEDTE